MTEQTMDNLTSVLEVMAALFVFVLGLLVVVVAVLYVVDVTQTKHAIRRNYPVFGCFRYLFEEVNRRGIDAAPDFITIDGGDGGTGAAPMALIDDVGLPLRESLPLAVDKLVEAGLRERIRVIASGKLVTPSEVAWALCVGADFVVSARGFMFALGCIQALQ